MKKIMLNQYGDVDVMKMTNVDIPKPSANQIVIKTVAIGVNDPDIGIRAKGPFSTMPKKIKPVLPHSLGQDFSGIVIAIGNGVTKYAVDDHVVGMSLMNTYSEYIVLEESALIAAVPKTLDLVPLGGFVLGAATAYAATIRDGQIKSGQKVLIHGGAGGVGSNAIQFAKNAGAHVIATGTANQTEYMKNLGADRTIDYRTQDFTKLVSNVDLVVNLTGLKTLRNSYKIVKKGGRITSVNAIINPIQTRLRGITGIYSKGILSTKELVDIIEIYNQGKLHVTIDKTYPFDLDDIKQAHLDFQAGGNTGKKIIVFDNKADLNMK
ncbi:NADP-dependent oxidoreductase [Companilactobacillus alimentarius]|uniref:Oxidoreductase n=1 Tax=Companilactobacillus alimentarius DSM 20249 TaxID=1423720 RepID=A0A2K9HME2_9LACO|nr:NADP-dependent oxidoreductase [Companilactobacillus alimentarius]AUI71173.1 oxidoreductase [Companilactobacillus alimentarius DSM 20249]KRK75302.1 oxidoreductase [Companilactobacillus alimentarius DSM 20249]GEO43916.1 NADPH:quinone reductase [Companilactobacillus alimentarius]